MVKKIAAIALVLSLLFLISSCGILHNNLEDFFEEWTVTEDTTVAIVDEDKNTILVNGECIDFCEKLKPYYDNPDSSNIRLLFIRDNKLYGTQSYNYLDEHYRETIDIFTLNLTSYDCEVLYTGKYCPYVDNENIGLYHAEKYYSDGVIFIYDGVVATKYTVNSGELETVAVDDFTVPDEIYSLEKLYDENGDMYSDRIKIIAGNDERIISLDYMAQRHDYAYKLTQLEPQKTIFSTVDPLVDFFYSEYVVNGKIYLLCCVRDKDGEINCVAFSYDYPSDKFEYIYHSFTNDYPNIYFVEIE